MKLLLYDTRYDTNNKFFKILKSKNNLTKPFFRMASFSDYIYELNDELYEWISFHKIECDIFVETYSGYYSLWYLEFNDDKDAMFFKLTWM